MAECSVEQMAAQKVLMTAVHLAARSVAAMDRNWADNWVDHLVDVMVALTDS